jgi:hypothetical protein
MTGRKISIWETIDGSDGLDPLSSYYRGREDQWAHPADQQSGDHRLYIESLGPDAGHPDVTWNLGGINNEGGLVLPSDQAMFDFMNLVPATPRPGADLDLRSPHLNPLTIKTLTGGLRGLPRALVGEAVTTANDFVVRGELTMSPNANVPSYWETLFYTYLKNVSVSNDRRLTEVVHYRVLFSRYIYATKELRRTWLAQMVEGGVNVLGYNFDAERKTENTTQALARWFPRQEAIAVTLRDLVIQDLQSITADEAAPRREFDGDAHTSPRWRADEARYRRYIVFKGLMAIWDNIKSTPTGEGFADGEATHTARVTMQAIPNFKRKLLQGFAAGFGNFAARFQKNEISFDSTFVMDGDTHPLWTTPSAPQIPYAYIEPEYNQYIPAYEKGISEGEIPEKALPSAYALSLYRDKAEIERVSRRTLKNGADYLKMATYNVPPNSQLGKAARAPARPIGEYYQAVGNYVAEGMRLNLPTAAIRNEKVIIPSTEDKLLEDVKRRKNIYPLRVDVSFDRSPWLEGGAAGIIHAQNVSVNVLDALDNTDSTPSTFATMVSYIDARRYNNEPDHTIQSFYNHEVIFRTWDIGDIFTVDENTRISNTVYSALDLEPSRRINEYYEMSEEQRSNVATAQRLITARATLKSRNAFKRIMNNAYGQTSDAIGYRLQKKDPENQEVLQTIMIGNTTGSLNTSYIDTQVIYGKEYQYALDEYRLVSGVKYDLKVVADLHLNIVRDYLNLPPVGDPGGRQNSYWNSETEKYRLGTTDDNGDPVEPGEYNLPRPMITFDFYAKEVPVTQIVEVPIYNNQFYRTTLLEGARQSYGGRGVPSSNGVDGVSYPTTKILDRPPTAPNMTVYPLMGNSEQVIISMNPETGAYLGAAAQQFIPISASANAQILEDHQRQFDYFALPLGHLEFKNEGLREIQNLILFRTTRLNRNVATYTDLYSSFNPALDNVLVRKYTTNPVAIAQNHRDLISMKSYDVTDLIKRNVDYFYTCVAQDIHGNLSNPSQITRVRLSYEKGLLVPEVSSVEPKFIDNKNSSKDLARYIKIEASNIQSFPYLETDISGNIGQTAANLGIIQGNSIKDKTFILRLTSQDTGRKFDLKINFGMKVDGNTI